MRPAVVAGTVACLLTLAACSSSSSSASSTGPTPSTTASTNASPTSASRTRVLDVAAAAPLLTTFAAAAKAAGLTSTLSGKGPFTVFAPTNAAFTALPNHAAANLLLPCNKAVLAKVIRYHIVRGDLTVDKIVPGSLPTLEGAKVAITTGGGVVAVNNLGIIDSDDTPATNGVVKTMGAVLTPPGVNLKKLPAAC